MSPAQSTEPVPSTTYAYRVPVPGQDDSGGPERPPRRWVGPLLFLLLALLAGAIAWRTYTARRQAQTEAAQKKTAMLNRSVPVQVTAVVRRTTQIYLTGLGTVTPYYSVKVIPRVTGELLRVDFKEGQEVSKGAELMLIDPRPYQATLDQAKGQLARDQAQLKNNQAEFARYQALYNQGVVSKEQLDTYQSNLGQFLGAIKADEAAVESDALNVRYCHVTSPIDGRVGLRLVDPGNLVIANQTQTLLINQFRPIAVEFTLPEAQLGPVLTKLRHDHRMQAEAYNQTDTNHLESGTLLTADNQIDTSTGTDKLKAVFANTEELLFPNQFVNVHLITDTRQNALVIPAAALQHGGDGDYVWLVKPDETVAQQPVKVGAVEGATIVLDAGLEQGQFVVTDGADKLRDGDKVVAHQVRPTPSSPAATETPGAGHQLRKAAHGGSHATVGPEQQPPLAPGPLKAPESNSPHSSGTNTRSTGPA